MNKNKLRTKAYPNKSKHLGILKNLTLIRKMKVPTLSQHFLQTHEDTRVQAAPWAGPHYLHAVAGDQRAPPRLPSPPACLRPGSWWDGKRRFLPSSSRNYLTCPPTPSSERAHSGSFTLLYNPSKGWFRPPNLTAALSFSVFYCVIPFLRLQALNAIVADGIQEGRM